MQVFRYPETTDVPVWRAISAANAVCHGVRSECQQSPRGHCVSRVYLIVAGLDVDDYELTLFDRAESSLGLFIVDGFPQGPLSPRVRSLGVPQHPSPISGKHPDNSKMRFP